MLQTVPPVVTIGVDTAETGPRKGLQNRTMDPSGSSASLFAEAARGALPPRADLAEVDVHLLRPLVLRLREGHPQRLGLRERLVAPHPGRRRRLPDGQLLFWDVRDMTTPMDSCILTDGNKESPKTLGGVCLEWMQEAGPTKYLIGTEHGIILSANKKPKKLASAGKDLRNKPLLKALAQREEAVRTGKLATIIYVRDFNAKGHEIAGYVDYAHRLRTTDFEAVFDGKKTIMPTPRDLSYFNWQTMNSAVTSSENWTVLTDDERGLLFKHARDGKIVDVDPDAEPGDNTARFDIKTDEYHHVVLYDHITRRRK